MAEKLFSEGIDTWLELKRPRDEIAELYKIRGNVRVDLKRFVDAKKDYDIVVGIMKVDAENADGEIVCVYVYICTYVYMCARGFEKICRC